MDSTELLDAKYSMDTNESERKQISRQRRWQIKMRALGRCPACGKKTTEKVYCAKHRRLQSERVMRRYHKMKDLERRLG
jgi:hypothetical protein